jgi:gluconolactonase
MKYGVLTLALSALFLRSLGTQPSPSTLGSIERLKPEFDSLIPGSARIEKLAEGFEWTEGPVWVSSRRYLLFSDIPRNVVMKWEEGRGTTKFLERSGYTGTASGGREPGSNGLALDAQGRLVLCQHGDRQIVRVEEDGTRTVLASKYQGKRLNSPNDLVYGPGGDLYFTDPPYGLSGLNEDPAKELDFNGVYRLTPDGQLTLLTSELSFPNGIGFSPDGRILYVANSDPKRAIWMAYDVDPDGTIGNGRVFFDATPLVGSRKGLPDGLKVDIRGNLFATGPGGVLVFSPRGDYLGLLNTREATANCGWGDDGSVLYVTADMYLCRVRTNTRGLVFK